MPSQLMRRQLVAVVGAVGLLVAGCGSPERALGTSPADLKAAWGSGDVDDVAFEIADRRLIVGWRRSQLHEALGRPDRSGTDWEEWTNGCSGPECYYLTVSFDGGRVSAVSFDDG